MNRSYDRTDTPKRQNKRDELLREGLRELNTYGLTEFSVRRVAENCGVSCSAPYKHFNDKNGFIAEIIKYVKEQWSIRQQQIFAENPGDLRKQLVRFSVCYVRFLVENPHFCSIIMQKNDSFDSVYHNLRGALSGPSQQTVLAYCREVQMTPEVMARKLYVVRSLIYGAAIMINNGEIEYNETNMSYVEQCVDREFDIL